MKTEKATTLGEVTMIKTITPKQNINAYVQTE